MGNTSTTRVRGKQEIDPFVTIEDRGEVCFKAYNGSHIGVDLIPSGCFSFSCTIVPVAEGSFGVDYDTFIIQAHAFYLRTARSKPSAHTWLHDQDYFLRR